PARGGGDQPAFGRAFQGRVLPGSVAYDGLRRGPGLTSRSHRDHIPLPRPRLKESPMPRLFTPLAVGGLQLSNRIVIAPMCQYSAEDGCTTDWHLIHLGQLALSGAALLTIEATAVLPEGRISYADVGLWDDRTESALARTLDGVRRWSDMPVAIQLAHAGRKASTDLPWLGGRQIAPDHPN